MVGLRLLQGGGRGEQGFGVFGEVVAAIGRVETFGEHDELCAVAGSFEDEIPRVAEVDVFVGAGGDLDAGELDRLREHGGG